MELAGEAKAVLC